MKIQIYAAPAVEGLSWGLRYNVQTWRWRTVRVASIVLRNINPFRPEFTIVIFIHYNSPIVDKDDLMWLKY